MTREQARENLKTLGVAEPTEEQVTNYLNQVGGETQKEKDLANKYKADALKVADLQKKLDDLNDANLSEIEKANKATETAQAEIAELKKAMATMERQKKLAEIGITGEQADKLFDADGKLDTEILGQIISAREETAKSLKEKELLKGTPDPKGGDKGGSEKTDADKLTEAIASELSGVNKSATDIVNSYL